jgi:NTP pyrophosphatase (non-canonical NTP hydrolase)
MPTEKPTPLSRQGEGGTQDDSRYDLRVLTAAMHDFVAGRGWYAPDSIHPQTPKNLAISLVLEASEVLEHFQWGESADRAALAGELADVFLYLVQIASVCEIDLSQAVLDKLNHNQTRTWERRHKA